MTPKKLKDKSLIEALKLLRQYREMHSAPVDTLGCDAPGESLKTAKQARFRILVSLLLSSQTKDALTHEATNALEKEFGLGPLNIANASTDKIKVAIKGVGFANKKAIYLKKTASICLQKYNSDIPRHLKDLLDLPGVGPKMAFLVLQSAWNANEGIGVDVHVFRISHRLGWASDSASTPELTRAELQNLLPKEEWPTINKLLVGLGQTICSAKNPKCGQCPLFGHCLYPQKDLF
ncbi:hypothetical protein BB561_000456 [Smittium simulii]|uniref:Endonuclease III homolog n=1 Tax=Smittium simulii TaxID=133385 RepID=A0A2T9YZ50_9FUNG|nr:hypothetical protein BB561_000456 [Smittium simulii]